MIFWGQRPLKGQFVGKATHLEMECFIGLILVIKRPFGTEVRSEGKK